jgi:hypothetical protein
MPLDRFHVEHEATPDLQVWHAARFRFGAEPGYWNAKVRRGNV